jgi:small subunit ribosomal protein S5
MGDSRNRNNDYGSNLQEKLIRLNRVAKVVKGGRRFSFSALMAVGDANGKVGIGFGKANEVADAISKASEAARKSMVEITLSKSKSIPHETIGKYKSSQVVMKPASPGTGVIAGGAVRSVLEVAGVHDILTKILGSKNQMNVTKAVMQGLTGLKNIKTVAERRNKKMTDLF